jgi:pimeloyl-ACP methyl ester carboxylesterase
MDNASSWEPLAPYLVSAGYKLFCIDLTGHGKSSHRDEGTPVMIWVVELIDFIKQLGLSDVYLMGHSMGAGISMITSSVLKNVKKLILVDLIAPMTLKEEYAPKLLEVALKERVKILTRKSRVYPDFESAVKKMLSTNPYIKESSVRLLVERGTEVVYSEGSEGVRFLHDPKLVGKPLQLLSEGQIDAFIHQISCPVLALMATERNFTMTDIEPRMKQYRDLKMVTVKGGHHIHMDVPEIVQQHILEFLGPAPHQSKM